MTSAKITVILHRIYIHTQMKQITIISPSGKPNTDLIDSAHTRLEQKGFAVTEGDYARCGFGRFAARKEERLKDILAAFRNPQNDFILCSRGGYGLQQLMGDISSDLAGYKADGGRFPILIGFSDITCLHSVLSLLSVPSVHGLMAHIGDWDEECESVRRWFDLLDGWMPCYSLPANEQSVKGEATGILVGGNLSVLYGLQGTPWSLNALIDNNARNGKQTLLFIEDIAERHYHIDRMMQTLHLSGVLGRISGLVVGQMTDIEPDPLMMCSIEQTVLQAVEGYDIPVLFGFPAGHNDNVNLPFLLGKETTIEVGYNYSAFEQN